MSLVDKIGQNKSQAGTGTAGGASPNDNANVSQQVKEQYFIYSTPLAEEFSVHLKEDIVKASGGLMTLNSDQHLELQKLMSNRPDIRMNLILLDAKAAEKIAQEHMQNQKSAAARGAHTTGSAVEAMRQIGVDAGKVRNLDVIEHEIHHADDAKFNPETGQTADNIPRE